jgi:hypothetical protein
MARIAAFIAGMGTGYVNGTRYEDERKRREERDRREQEEHDARMGDRADRLADKQKLRDAAAPVAVETPNDVKVDDDGNAMPAVPAYRVGAQRFDSQEAAAAAATKGNAPGARQARMLGAMEQTGDYAGAAQLRTATVQAQAAEQQLADRAMRDRLTSITTPNELATLISETPADGQGGALKIKAVTSADGKSFGFVKVGADGSEQPVPGSFSNDERGMEKARTLVAGYTTPEMRQQHFRWEAEREQRANEFAETRKMEQKRIDLTAQHYRNTEANQAATIGIARENATEAREQRKAQTLEGKVGALETALGRKLEGAERDSAVLKLAGLGKDEESLTKFAQTVVAEGVKGGTIAPENVGVARQKIISSIKQANQDAETAQVVSTELTAAKGDSTKYADSYGKVLKIPGMTAEYLNTLGFPPPAKLKPPGPKPMAAAGIPRGRTSFGPVTDQTGVANAQNR